MTGFGSALACRDFAEVEVSARTVNGRFLEVRVHLPREYLPFEGQVRKFVSQKLQRGTVDIFVVRRPGPKERRVDIRTDTELARNWVKAVRHLADEVGIEGTPTLATLLSVPELLRIEEKGQIGEGEGELLQEVLAKAVEICVRERRREGRALKKNLLVLLSQLHEISLEIAKLRAGANERLRARYEERLRKLGYPGDVDPERVVQEVVLQIDRVDINEELQRLREHVRAYKALLGDAAAQGKKLDFYTQELLREVNTIGAKSQWAEITHWVVQAKSIIEQLREQVQNIE